MPRYLVESYATPRQAAEVELALRGLAEQGSVVRHVRSTFVPQDEICFHFVEAPSLQAVHDALLQAAIAYDRIVEGIESVR